VDDIEIKSIAVPVTRKRAATKSGSTPVRSRGRPPMAPDQVVGGTVGAGRKVHGPTVGTPRHRYRIGERVRLGGGGNSIKRMESVCKVMTLMPYEGGALQYRVRSELESYERVVAETDLSPIR
jgi:hypothetical protein